jgi:hypothetical protein
MLRTSSMTREKYNCPVCNNNYYRWLTIEQLRKDQYEDEDGYFMKVCPKCCVEHNIPDARGQISWA